MVMSYLEKALITVNYMVIIIMMKGTGTFTFPRTVLKYCLWI